MKILITGIHGFVGSNLVAYLAKDNELYGLDIIAPEKEGVVKTYSWDDLDAGRVPAVDAIIHLAGKTLSTNELIEEICRSLGKRAHVWHLPKSLMNGVAKLGGALHLPINPERLRKLTENYVSSNAKIKKALGVECMPVDARTGLQKTLKSFNQG